MNKYILISLRIFIFYNIIFFYCMSIETYKNYKNEYDAVKKLKYINRVFLKTKVSYILKNQSNLQKIR